MNEVVVDIGLIRQTRTGIAICIGCKHQWKATGFVEETAIKCPECKTYKGIWTGLVWPKEGVRYWECDCGNPFYLKMEDGGDQCINCGLIHYD